MDKHSCLLSDQDGHTEWRDWSMLTKDMCSLDWNPSIILHHSNTIVVCLFRPPREYNWTITGRTK